MKSSKIVTALAATSGGLLAATGLAVAVDLPDLPDPSVAESKVPASAGQPVDAGAQANEGGERSDTAEDHAQGPKVDDLDFTQQVSTDSARPQNHGWFVSQEAQDDDVAGANRGEDVRVVAQSDAGKPDTAGGPSDAQVGATTNGKSGGHRQDGDD